jgi:Xaa-Pro aminopeptidase
VHEGPASLAKANPTALKRGMILSNEPGYYKTGAYGIRIENLVLVVPSSVGENYLELETLTLCPIDLRLVDDSLLLQPERDWLNAYHKRVFRQIGPALKGEVKTWLKEATRPI